MWFVKTAVITPDGDYRGKRKLTEVSGFDSKRRLLEENMLITYNFEMKNTEGFIKYFGVLDIDFDMSKEDKDKFIKDPKVDEEIISLIEQRYKHYQIYFSGSKGLHVYIKDDKLLIKLHKKDSSNPKVIDKILEDLYPKELIQLIDKSIYKNAIRSYKQPHPITKITPKLLKYTTNFDPIDWLSKRLTCAWKKDFMTFQDQPIEIKTLTNSYVTSDLIDILTSNGDQLHQATMTSRYCPIADRLHKTRKCKWYPIYQGWSCSCMSSTCQGQRKNILKRCEPITKMDFKTLPKSETKIESENRYLPKNVIRDLYVSDKRLVLLIAPMGSGKTTQLTEVVEEFKPKMLVLSTRIIQASYFGTIFKKSTDYRNDENLYEVDRLIICLNSLLRIINSSGDIPIYDLLILDEIVSIIQTLSSPLLYKSKIVAIFELLKCLIKTSKKVILMDGLPNETIEDYLTIIGQWSECHVVSFMTQPESRIFHICNEPYRFMSQLKTESKIVCVCDSKIMTEFLRNKLKDRKTLVVNGDSKIEEKREFCDPNKNLIKYDVLIYNTAIGPGASFDIPDYFEKLFVVINVNGATPYDVYQMMCRIRKYKENQVIILYVAIDGNSNQDHLTVDHFCNNIIEFDKLVGDKILNLPVSVIELSDVYKETLQYTGVTGQKRSREKAGLDDYRELIVSNGEIEETLGTKRKRLKLVYEKNEFITFLVQMKLIHLKFQKKDYYLDCLKKIIYRNGGTIKDEIILEKEADANKWLQSTKKENSTCKGFFFEYPEEYTENDKKKIKKILGDTISNHDIEQRFLWFWGSKQPKEIEYFTKDNKYKIGKEILPDRALNTFTVYSIVRDSFEKLLSILNMKLENGFIRGQFSTEFLLDNAQEINKVMIKYDNERRKTDQYYEELHYKDGQSKLDIYKTKSIELDVLNFFKWMGFQLERFNFTKKRVSWNSNKPSNFYTFHCPEKNVNLRLAIKGINFETFRPDDKSLLLFKERYLLT